jgi:hypothetical protein
MMIGATGPLTGHVKWGKLRALATAALNRDAAYPELPTVIERLPRIQTVDWHSIAGALGRARSLTEENDRSIVPTREGYMSQRKPCLACVIVAVAALSLVAIAISFPIRTLVRRNN